MKQLTCEMCGSTDLLKQDGVFVCQSCGCKYSVEEAKKMMVEGTVEVSGTVKVDDTAKIENYLELSNTAYNAGNGQSAFDYANKALEIAPRNSKAWIAKMKAIEYIATLGDLKLMEVVEAGKNAITYADEEHKADITSEVYTYEVTRALTLLKLATGKMADVADIKKTFDQFCRISILSAPKNTMDVDNKITSIYDNVANEALALIKFVPDDVLADSPQIAKIVGECAKQYQYETDALLERMKIYCAELTAAAKQARTNNRKEIENKYNAAEKISRERKAKEQAQRNEKYWEEHKEERALLEAECKSVTEQITALETEREKIPEIEESRKVQKDIHFLTAKRDSLGLFKGKEKKAIQEQIDAANMELKTVSDKIEAKKKEIEQKIEPLNARYREIVGELNKAR